MNLPPELATLFEPLVEITEKAIRDMERMLEQEERRKHDLRELQKVTIKGRR